MPNGPMSYRRRAMAFDIFSTHAVMRDPHHCAVMLPIAAVKMLDAKFDYGHNGSAPRREIREHQVVGVVSSPDVEYHGSAAESRSRVLEGGR